MSAVRHAIDAANDDCMRTVAQQDAVDPGDSLRVGTPTALFETEDFVVPAGIRQHHFAPDGRFLMPKNTALNADVEQIPAQVVLVQNWFEELKCLVPTE